MPRYKVIIEYDGTPFAGWQIQANGLSIQGELARAILGFCGECFVPRGAGRTDAGVHARGQAAHFDLSRDFPPQTVRDALNFHLRPAPIAILDCAIVDESFDARFSAKRRRHYLYRIVTRRARSRSTPTGPGMYRAARHRGHAGGRAGTSRQHDFTTFRAAECQAKSPMRTLDRLRREREGETFCIFDASARSFSIIRCDRWPAC